MSASSPDHTEPTTAAESHYDVLEYLTPFDNQAVKAEFASEYRACINEEVALRKEFTQIMQAAEQWIETPLSKLTFSRKTEYAYNAPVSFSHVC